MESYTLEMVVLLKKVCKGVLDSKKHTRKQTRERLLCNGKKWRQRDCRQSHQKPSKHG